MGIGVWSAIDKSSLTSTCEHNRKKKRCKGEHVAGKERNKSLPEAKESMRKRETYQVATVAVATDWCGHV